MKELTLEEFLANLRAENEMARQVVKVPHSEMLESYYKIYENLVTQNNFEMPSESTKSKIDSLINWVLGIDTKNVRANKGFLFAGNTGIGKTIMMKSLRELLKFYRISYKTGNEVKMLAPVIISAKEIVRAFNENGSDTITYYSRVPSICIDDIGAEGIAMSYGNKCNIVEDIIDARTAANLLTFGTTNIAKLSDYYDDRTISRMAGCFNIFSFTDKIDHRKK